jgi:hypothetical protein
MGVREMHDPDERLAERSEISCCVVGELAVVGSDLELRVRLDLRGADEPGERESVHPRAGISEEQILRRPVRGIDVRRVRVLPEERSGVEVGAGLVRREAAPHDRE